MAWAGDGSTLVSTVSSQRNPRNAAIGEVVLTGILTHG
jgi:hypothetical protein